MTNQVHPGTTVVATGEQLSADLAGEIAILDTKRNIYFGLDPVGARIWQMVQEPCTAADLCTRLQSEFDVDPDRCQREVLALLQALLQQGLIKLLA